MLEYIISLTIQDSEFTNGVTSKHHLYLQEKWENVVDHRRLSMRGSFLEAFRPGRNISLSKVARL